MSPLDRRTLRRKAVEEADGLPVGVSRWVFIAVGAMIGVVVGAVAGSLPSLYIAWAILDAFPVAFGTGTWLWIACWIWCVLAAAAIGGYLGYHVWRTDD
jgi:hypothetical protein